MPSSTSVTSASTREEDRARQNVTSALGAAAFVAVGERRRFLQQRFRFVVDRLRALLGDRQALHVRQDRVDARLVGGEPLLQLGQRRRAPPRCGPAARRSGSLPFSRPVRMSRNVAGVLAEQERDLGVDFVAGRERVRVLRDPLRQHRRAGSRTRSRAACRRPAPICCAACCDSSRIALLPWLMPSRPLASVVRLFSLSSSRLGARRRPGPSAP